MFVLATVALITIYCFFSEPPSKYERKQTTREEEELGLPKKPPHTEKKEQNARPAEEVPLAMGVKIAIIIDDIGFNIPLVGEFLNIEAPIAFAVLPFAPYSDAAAEMLHGAGREILLHLPMEPLDPNKNPGPGALFCRMEETEIRRKVEEDISNVSHAIGVNNHMGSAFMEDRGKLVIVFEELKKKNLFFIDSRTTPTSRGEELAAKMGIRFAARKVFMDNGQDYEITVKSLFGLLEKKGGDRIIIIGHPYHSTILALKEAIPVLKAKGVKIVPLTEMIEIVGGEGNGNKKGLN